MQFLKTADGSCTLQTASGETYHSLNGAVAESTHVFIDAGLKKAAENFNEINLLEVGFGTGLNAWLTLLFAQSNSININYHAIEPFPIGTSIAEKLGYADYFNAPEEHESFMAMHQQSGNHTLLLNELFSFTKYHFPLLEFSTDKNFHLVYYDAFSSKVQPELWNEAHFQKVNELMHPNGILVTYASNNALKNSLKACNFSVHTLPGAAGKREMVRAMKK